MQNAHEDSQGEETGTCLNDSVKKDNLRVIDVTGGHGPWQFRHWALFFLATFCTSLQLFSTLPLMTLSSCHCSNSTGKNSLSQPSACDISHCNESNQSRWSELSEPCFSPFPSILDEDLEEENSKCSNAGVVLYSKVLFATGCLLSAFITYPLMRKFGRRSVSLVMGFLLFSCSMAGIWAFAPVPYLVLKFILSSGVFGTYLITAFSLADCVTGEFRLLYFYTGHISWGLAHFILPLFIWIIPRWTSYNVILSVPCFFLLIMLCFLPETVESYISRGLWTRAHKVMRNAARCNGFSVQGVEQVSQNLILHQSNEEGDYVFSCNIKDYSHHLEHILLFLIGFFSSFIYFISMWLTDWLQIKRESFFSLLGTTEIASVLILLFFSYFVSVRKLWAVTSCMSSILLIIMYTKEAKEVPRLSRASYIVEMFFASASWTIVVLHTLSQSLNTKKVRCKILVIGMGVCIGLLGAALTDLQKLTGWNRNLLLIISVPNLIVGICMGLIPKIYFNDLNL